MCLMFRDYSEEAAKAAFEVVNSALLPPFSLTGYCNGRVVVRAFEALGSASYSTFLG